MAKPKKKIGIDDSLKKKSDIFMRKVNSDMFYKSELTSELMSFEWLNEIEFACPYLDNIVRNPKVALIKEEDVVKIEKAKKISVDSVKDLSRHTHYIEKITEDEEVQPSKLLITRNEQTFNIYENRFIFTLIHSLLRFVTDMELQLNDFESTDDKVLEYAASTVTNDERVNIELKITASELPKDDDGNDMKKEIENIRLRIKKIKDYISSWRRSEFISSLEKAHVYFVIPPIKKTNMILKNPNFQIAIKLWDFLRTYQEQDRDGTKDSLNTAGDDALKGILDSSFLMDYYVLDSISSSKREQKDKLSKYAVIMVKHQVQRIVSLLFNSGIKISDEELLGLVSNEIKDEKSKIAIGSTDVKKKFKNEIDEYLERTQDYL